jgi:hypothetical protein
MFKGSNGKVHGTCMPVPPHHTHPLCSQTFRPKKKFPEGTLRYQLHKKATVRVQDMASALLTAQ